MELQLSKELSNCRVVTGFPGFGLVATIATEFLVEHLNAEFIGKYWFEDGQASIAIHEGKVINPISVYYIEKHNLVIVHSIAGQPGTEWQAANLVSKVLDKVSASELICLEGVASSVAETNDSPKIYYYTNTENDLSQIDTFEGPLKEGVILGVTAALMMKSNAKNTSFFIETHSQLPDSKAAAKLIEALDKYVGMEVDYKPLLETAEQFEEKLKGLIQQSQAAQEVKTAKDLNYVG